MITLGLAAPAGAQDTPRHGGELVFVVAAEPPSFDGHREETFAMPHPTAPHYNTLLRVDPTDKSGTRFVGDLAESWTVSADKRTYTFKLGRGVKFHDGSPMTSKDVKASYDPIVFPPPGVVSSRQAAYRVVEAVEAPTPDTVVFPPRVVRGLHPRQPRLAVHRALHVRGERAMIQFRGFTPADRDSLVAALGTRLTVQESAWNCSIQVAMNQQ